MLDPSGTFQYFVPLMVPVIAFMFERVQHVREASFFQHGVGFLVFALAVGRVVGDVPFIFGPYSTSQLCIAMFQIQDRSHRWPPRTCPNTVFEILRLA